MVNKLVKTMPAKDMDRDYGDKIKIPMVNQKRSANTKMVTKTVKKK